MVSHIALMEEEIQKKNEFAQENQKADSIVFHAQCRNQLRSVLQQEKLDIDILLFNPTAQAHNS